MKKIKKLFVFLIKQTDIFSALAVRLTKILGRSSTPIHPKHFLNNSPWFVEGLSKNDVVLDLGSGNGQNAIKAGRKCKRVVGLELDDALLALANKSISGRRRNIQFIKANLEKPLSFKANFFDRIIFLDVLEHLNNRDLILKEAYRVLKKDGLLYVGVPNSQTSWKKYQRSAGISSFSDPDHKIEFSQLQIVNLLTKGGFKIKTFGYGKFDIPFRGIIDVFGAISLSLYKKVDNFRASYARRHPIEASGFEIVAVKK